jgi:hypothetical protein
VSVRGTAAGTLRGVVIVAASCGPSPVAQSVPVGAGRFQAHLRLPSRCRSARTLRVTVTWRGSSAFAHQTVSRTVAIRR